MRKFNAWDSFKNHVTELNTLRSIIGLLTWDQQTHMPVQGGKNRSQEIAYLSQLSHQKQTDSHYGDVIKSALDESAEDDLKVVALKEALKRHNKAICVPTKLVGELSAAKSISVSKWEEAKAKNDFGIFEPHLNTVVSLTREYATCFGNHKQLYNNLLDEYDPGMTVDTLDPLFSRLKIGLTDFVANRSQARQAEPLSLKIPSAVLTKINERVIRQLGFDKGCGNLGLSAHPFTCGLTPNDVRLTTHNHETDLIGTLSGTIHECGHGLYEQGLPLDLRDIGLCEAAGCGIHESQSRFYENTIGKSLSFFKWLSPIINKELNGNVVTAEQLYGAANRVTRSSIRIYSDESTYNLHIIVRYELEKALFEGNLEAKDLPAAWNEKYSELVGIKPNGMKDGVLQDIHWSMGLIGYFPSYTIGNLYAASFKAKMEEDIPNLWSEIERGEFDSPLKWLRQHVHQHGNRMPQEEILINAVGQRDQVEDLMRHLNERQNLCASML